MAATAGIKRRGAPELAPTTKRPRTRRSNTMLSAYGALAPYLADALVNLVAAYVPVTDLVRFAITASRDQATAFDTIVTHRSDAQYYYMSGHAGTGKSFLIDALRVYYGLKCVVLAPTGIAALHVGGITIDMCFAQHQDLTSKALVIVDESGMCSAQKLDMVLDCGATRVLLVGDMCQLPPVFNSRLDSLPERTNPRRDNAVRRALRRRTGRNPITGALFPFEHPVFANIVHVHLSTNHRQRGLQGDPLPRVLDSLRQGRETSTTRQLLADKHKAYTNLKSKDTVLHAFSKRDAVDQHNLVCLSKLLASNPDQREVECSTTPCVTVDSRGNLTYDVDPRIASHVAATVRDITDFWKFVALRGYSTSRTDLPMAVSAFARSRRLSTTRRPVDTELLSLVVQSGRPYPLIVPEDLVTRVLGASVVDNVTRSARKAHRLPARGSLKVVHGSRMMVTANNPKSGAVNGMIGVITSLKPLVLRLDDGTKIDICPKERVYSDAKHGISVVTSSIPLTLAYATTIHGIQGLTLRELAVSLRHMWAPGSAYVAFSRLRSSAHLYVVDMPTNFKWRSMSYPVQQWQQALDARGIDTDVSGGGATVDMQCVVSSECAVCGRFVHKEWESWKCRH